MPFLFLEFIWLNMGGVVGEMLFGTSLASEVDTRGDLDNNISNFLIFCCLSNANNWSTWKLSFSSHVLIFGSTMNVSSGKPRCIASRYINTIYQLHIHHVMIQMLVTSAITLQMMDSRMSIFKYEINNICSFQICFVTGEDVSILDIILRNG